MAGAPPYLLPYRLIGGHPPTCLDLSPLLVHPRNPRNHLASANVLCLVCILAILRLRFSLSLTVLRLLLAYCVYFVETVMTTVMMTKHERGIYIYICRQRPCRLTVICIITIPTYLYRVSTEYRCLKSQYSSQYSNKLFKSSHQSPLGGLLGFSAQCRLPAFFSCSATARKIFENLSWRPLSAAPYLYSTPSLSTE